MHELNSNFNFNFVGKKAHKFTELAYTVMLDKTITNHTEYKRCPAWSNVYCFCGVCRIMHFACLFLPFFLSSYSSYSLPLSHHHPLSPPLVGLKQKSGMFHHLTSRGSGQASFEGKDEAEDDAEDIIRQALVCHCSCWSSGSPLTCSLCCSGLCTGHACERLYFPQLAASSWWSMRDGARRQKQNGRLLVTTN